MMCTLKTRQSTKQRRSSQYW